MATTKSLYGAKDGDQTSPEKSDGEEEPFAFETAAGINENEEDDKNN